MLLLGGDYCKIISGFAFRSNEFTETGVPVIRISNIVDGLIKLDMSVCSNRGFAEDNTKHLIHEGDVLMAMSGATTGKTGYFDSRAMALLNQRVACLRSIPGVSIPAFVLLPRS